MRMPPYKPTGYPTVCPYLIVTDAAATIAFLKRVFGADELRRFPDAEGRIMHAEVRVEDAVVMLADESLPDWPAVASYVHIYVADVDAVHQRALSAGATSVQEPVVGEGEAERRGGVRDPGGTTWWMATRIA